ncbi:MAG: N-carbamoylputrescine amidase [Deltaproteobacteria bacterium]|nr:N-carbamoylputrescine amidase [Deltaproteobacteria bacterium]
MSSVRANERTKADVVNDDPRRGQLTVAVIQCPLPGPREGNIACVERWVRHAAAQGAQVVLPPELFEGRYFPQREDPALFEEARPLLGNSTIAHFAKIARELQVVVPISFFERDGQAYYNSVAVIDATGEILGLYRKSHIPDGPGYSEKYYFRPGDTGFRVFDTQFGTIGVGICWDQWYPECARTMTLLGAEILLYPTAIGTEPAEPEMDTKDPWQRVMIGHAVANSIPVAAANRIGGEDNMSFYGSSFIANSRGDKVVELSRTEEGVALAHFDRKEVAFERNAWGFFRDRRTDLYETLLTADGHTRARKPGR